MPKENAPQRANPAKPKASLQAFKVETDPAQSQEIIINSRKRPTRKMAAGRNEAADHLILAPPDDKNSPTTREIIIKSTTPAPRRNTTTTGTGATSRSRAGSRSATNSGGNSRPSAGRPRPPTANPVNFHETDQLPPVSDSTRHEITGIVLIVTGLILLFGMLADQGLIAQFGMFVKRLCGIGAFIIPPLIVIMGGTFIWEGLTHRERFNQTRITGLIFMVVAFVSVVHLMSGNSRSLAESGGGGGFFAYYINDILSGIVTPIGVVVLWVALFLVGTMLSLSMSLRDMGRAVQNGYRRIKGVPPLVSGEAVSGYDALDDFEDDDFDDYADFSRKQTPARRASAFEDDDDLLDDLLLNGQTKAKRKSAIPEVPERQYTHSIKLDEDIISPATPSKEVAPANPKALAEPAPKPEKGQRPAQPDWKSDDNPATATEIATDREWQVPSVNTLASFSDVEVNPQELRKKARLIENTLSSFGVEAWVREVNTGPTVTQFALEPGMGVKVARITALANDLALALAAPAIRLEAPVPGQSRVGIEVPNNKIATVGLREIMEADEFVKRSGRLKFALGRDVSGQPIIADLAKMPHLLIAGSTGSGKSVCLNSIVAAYLLQYRPTELQFIMIDPKMVELSTYNGIPHLRFPVVTQIESDPEKERDRNDRTPTVMSVLKWSIREMERRYKLLSLYGHRNIESFNKAAGNGNNLEKLSYLVLIVDELADLMMVAPEEAESAICRLAQKARAVGIHLILATQRPSVDVVTGLIKANFPSRITFAVTSQIDSRVILDMAGAEKLLGRGDMLYMAADAPKPSRVQGVYVSDEEIDTLVKHWRQQQNFLTGQQKDFVQPQIWPTDLQQIEAENGEEEPDELFEAALEIVREARTASTSLLQRRLRIGYNRAARLIEELAGAGVIGQAEGSKPRPVLLADEDLNGGQSLTAAANDFEPELPSFPATVTPTPVEDVPITTPSGGAKPALTFPAYDPDAPIMPRQNRPPDPLPPLSSLRQNRTVVNSNSDLDLDLDPPI